MALSRARVRFPGFATERIGDIQYVRLHAFDPEVATTVRRTLVDCFSQSTRAWIVDVRGNAEGSLQEVVNLASLFIGEQTVASEENRAGQRAPVRGTSRQLMELRPLTVLIDGGTAGPAELFAAALRDYDQAILVGTPTPGRMGTTGVVPLPDGSLVQLASGRFLSPSGGILLGTGVVPDIPVAPQSQALAYGDDLQLRRALVVRS